MAMRVETIVSAIIGLTVAVIVVATVLLPVIDGLNITDTTQKTLFSVVGILAILAVVMMSVRMISDRS